MWGRASRATTFSESAISGDRREELRGDAIRQQAATLRKADATLVRNNQSLLK
jgi:hypothetical protein